MPAIRGPTERDEPGYRSAVTKAIGRHNDVLRLHVGHPISYGSGIYLLCQCGTYKGTFAGFEEHCQRSVVDASVRA